MLWSSRGFHQIEMNPHRHDMHELFFCLNDNGTQHVGGKSCAFKRGQAFFLYSGVWHHLSHTPDNVGEFVFFCFDPGYFLDSGMENIHRHIQKGKEEKLFFSGTEKNYLDENIENALRLHDELNSGRLLSEDFARGLLALLAVSFFRSIGIDFGISRKDSDNARLSRLTSEIINNPGLDYSLDEAAAGAGMCRTKFTRKFKSFSGMSFSEFINDARLKKACRLLSDSDVSVSEAAFKSGFSNLGYFHRVFREKFGYTPLNVKRIFRENSYPHFLREL